MNYEYLEIAANFCKFNSPRKIYKVGGHTYMEIFGHKFWYNPDTDLYELDDEGEKGYAYQP